MGYNVRKSTASKCSLGVFWKFYRKTVRVLWKTDENCTDYRQLSDQNLLRQHSLLMITDTVDHFSSDSFDGIIILSNFHDIQIHCLSLFQEGTTPVTKFL